MSLSVRDLSAGYGETRVLSGVSLEVPDGGTVALLGRNGVGKTTLLASILGHTTLHGGSIRFGDTQIERLPPFKRARLGIGFVPQEREIFPSLSVEENLTVAAKAGRWTLDRVYTLFPNLSERRRSMGNQLSGGEQQMLSIGRALLLDPALLLLDEPLEGLAPVMVDRLFAALTQIRDESGIMIVLVEQHARMALEFSQHTTVLDHGEVVFAGHSRALLDDPGRLGELIGVGE